MFTNLLQKHSQTDNKVLSTIHLKPYAVTVFNAARGHEMERENYTDDLKNGCNGGLEIHLNRGYMSKMHSKRNMDEKKKKRQERDDQTREDLKERWTTRNVAESQKHKATPKKVDNKPSRRDDETPGSWRRDQELFRQQQIQQQQQMNYHNPSFQQFYEPSAQTSMDYYVDPYSQDPYGWPGYHQPPSQFLGPPEDFQPPEYDVSEHEGDSGEVKARFSWTPHNYNSPPPPAPWLRNPDVKVYSPGGSDPFPASFQRGKRSGGYHGGKGQKRRHN